MPVTEVAILRLPSSDPPSQHLLANLKKAKDAMENVSGYTFFYYSLVSDSAPDHHEDENLIFIVGTWPSVDFHMNEWIPSEENQDLLRILESQVSVDAMFDVDVDLTIMQLSKPLMKLAVVRYFVEDGKRPGLERVFEEAQRDMKMLNRSTSRGDMAGGWRIDKDQGGEEFVLFVRLEAEIRGCEDPANLISYEQMINLAVPEGTSIDMRHTRLLNVNGSDHDEHSSTSNILPR